MTYILVLAVLLPVAAYRPPLPTDCSYIHRVGSGQEGIYTSVYLTMRRLFLLYEKQIVSTDNHQMFYGVIITHGPPASADPSQ